MPAREGRRDLTAADARAEARITGLREAAAHATTVLERQAADEPGEADAHAAAEKPRRGFRWPFSRKPDPEVERQAEIFRQLEAVAADRPRAAERARQLENQPAPQRDGLRAAG
jgi:hypothetical protein